MSSLLRAFLPGFFTIQTPVNNIIAIANDVLKQPLPLPSHGDVYLVVKKDGVKASYGNIEDAKRHLMEKYEVGSQRPERMIVEVKKGTDITLDPHTIGGQNQGGGVDTGFNKFWYGWDSIHDMNNVASAYLEDHNGVLNQPFTIYLVVESYESDAHSTWWLFFGGGEVSSGVKGSYDNIEDAKRHLMENYVVGSQRPERMIVEVKRGTDITLDPHTIGGQFQGGGIDTGFNKFWRNWDSIIHYMNNVASAYLYPLVVLRNKYWFC